MPTLPVVRLVDDHLELSYTAPNATTGISRMAELPPDAEKLFGEWIGEYAGLARDRRNPGELAKLGTRMLGSLPQVAEFLDTLIEEEDLVPLLVEFAISRTDERPLASAFLDAPWELLATKGIHLAEKMRVKFCPVRRIGKARSPEPPSPYRLNIVFMAASPREHDNLNFEDEEVALLTATQHMGLDFTCEESGTLPLLAKRVADEHPDVVHLTCHGALHPKPILVLEDDFGGRANATPGDLLGALPQPLPRLLFSSACETAQADASLIPLTKHLLYAGAPAALGWAAPVLDNEATQLAAELYRRLAAGEALPTALAGARFALLTSEESAARTGIPDRSKDWHLARLYLGPAGGGPLATPNGSIRHANRGSAVRQFLDERGEVAIASQQEFVGRRRAIQDILREFRAERPDHAGVLIRGFGGQGKSSLAGRIAHRLEESHRPIVVYGGKERLERYGADAILGRFLDAYAGAEGIEAYRSRVGEVRHNPSALEGVLRNLLETICSQKQGKTLPALLIIDDFEKLLVDHSIGDHTVLADYRQTMSAIIRAFANSNTQSRLLITSRYLFTLPDGDRDLASKLLDLPLPPMPERDSRKQFFAKLRVTSQQKRPPPTEITRERFRALLDVSQGVPRLQDILFTLALEDAQKCDACLAQMRAYRDQGTAPDAQALRDLFADLTLDALLALLTPDQREVLRTSTLFELPVPQPVMEALIAQTLPDVDATTVQTVRHRLTALALWDTYEDLHNFHTDAHALHPLLRPRVGTLTSEEKHRLATALTLPLFDAWGGESGLRPDLMHSEIARLALLGEHAQPLTYTAAYHLRHLAEHFEYRRAAQDAMSAIHLLDAASIPPLSVSPAPCHRSQSAGWRCNECPSAPCSCLADHRHGTHTHHRFRYTWPCCSPRYPCTRPRSRGPDRRSAQAP